MIRTSKTHPLQIDSLSVPGHTGVIGLTFCPGKKQDDALTGIWDRDLQADLCVIRDWGANVLVTLMEQHELESLGVSDLESQVEHLDLEWMHLPIVDVSIPDDEFETQWPIAGPRLHRLLASGGRCALHCKGGLGRTGTIAARLLVECGVEPQDAINAVRQVRPGTIETFEQENYVFRIAGTV